MKVIETLEAQINKAGKNTPAAAVGYILIELCKSSPSIAQLVEQDLTNDSMDIGHCYQKLYDHASKNKKGNSYAMPPPKRQSGRQKRPLKTPLLPRKSGMRRNRGKSISSSLTR